MMTLASNKQSMKYSLQGERVPVYETDENGNIIYYTDSDGNKIPMETGEYTTGYSQPVSFFANGIIPAKSLFLSIQVLLIEFSLWLVSQVPPI